MNLEVNREQSRQIDNKVNISVEPYVLSEKEAARFIGMSRSFLQKDRMNGKLENRTPGPKWIKLGRRVAYPVQYLKEWVHANEVIGENVDQSVPAENSEFLDKSKNNLDVPQYST